MNQRIGIMKLVLCLCSKDIAREKGEGELNLSLDPSKPNQLHLIIIKILSTFYKDNATWDAKQNYEPIDI